MTANVRDFGAIGDGVANDTAAFNAASAASLDIYVPRGQYNLTGTWFARPATVITGDKWEHTRIRRVGNWAGPTLQFGVNVAGQGSYSAEVRQLLFEQVHPGFVQGTSTTMVDKLTSSQSHVQLYGGTNAIIEECWFEGGVYSIKADGCTNLDIRHNFFRGSWDFANLAVAETEAHIFISNSDVHGIATLNRVRDNYIAGGPLPVRSYTLGDITYSMARDGGAKYGILTTGCEGLEVSGNYIGGQNGYAVIFLPNDTICSNVDIHDNFFDGNVLGSITFGALTATGYTNIIGIHHNRFNGQMDSPRVLEVTNNAGHFTASGLIFDGNILNAHNKTPLLLFGLNGGAIKNNIAMGYNARGVGSVNPVAASPDFAAGCYIGQVSREVDFSGNKWGGGINGMGATNDCRWGVVCDGGANITASMERGILGRAGGAVVAGNVAGVSFTQTYPG